MCWLKNQVPARIEDKCCVSGVRGAGVVEPRTGPRRIFDRPRRWRLPEFRNRRRSRRENPARPPAMVIANAAPGPMCGPAISVPRRAVFSRASSSGRATSRAAFPAWSGRSRQCTAVKNRDSRNPEGHSQTGFDFTREIPRADHGARRGRPDCRPATCRRRHRAAARGCPRESSRLSPITNRWPAGTTTSGRLSSAPTAGELEDRVASVRRAAFRYSAPAVMSPCWVSRLSAAVALKRGRFAVDDDVTLAHRHAVARQSDHPLDPDLAAVARPAEHHNVAALRQCAKDAAGRWQRNRAPAARPRRSHREISVASNSSPISSVGSIEADGT